MHRRLEKITKDPELYVLEHVQHAGVPIVYPKKYPPALFVRLGIDLRYHDDVFCILKRLIKQGDVVRQVHEIRPAFWANGYQYSATRSVTISLTQQGQARLNSAPATVVRQLVQA
jgi:hypothetical protein